MQHDSAQLSDQVDRRWHPVFLVRATAGARMLLLGIGIFYLSTLLTPQYPRFRENYLLALLALVQVPTAAGFGRAMSPGRTRLLMLSLCIIDCWVVCAAGISVSRIDTPGLFCIAFAMGCAAILPWGVGHQAGLVAGAVLGLAVNVSIVPGRERLGTAEPFVLELVALVVSIYAAHAMEQSRRENAAHEIALEKAERELRIANTDLEKRVDERTVKLQLMVDELQMFSYTVSHDLRAPLRGINGLSGILDTEFSEVLGSEGRSYIGRIRAATVRMGAMIDSLLSLGRLTRAELHYTSVDMSGLAHEIAAELQAIAPERRVEWVVGPCDEVRGDAVLLRLVLQNLLGNAWKFTASRERARIELGVDRNCSEPVYFVRDNGSGFSMEHSSHIFDVFTRLHQEAEYEGTGVGLAIVRRIILRHGGRVWTSAVVSEGATFFFTLGRPPG